MVSPLLCKRNYQKRASKLPYVLPTSSSRMCLKREWIANYGTRVQIFWKMLACLGNIRQATPPVSHPPWMHNFSCNQQKLLSWVPVWKHTKQIEDVDIWMCSLYVLGQGIPEFKVCWSRSAGRITGHRKWLVNVILRNFKLVVQSKHGDSDKRNLPASNIKSSSVSE